MKSTDRIRIHNECASTYDSQVREYKSYGHDIMFGMCYEFIKRGDSLLDLGIGTGLSSINFARAGLDVYGMDGSASMLKECRKKGFARELKQHNITEIPLPYSDNSFTHVISCGVYHFFGDLQPLIKEACRLVQPGGVFAFTVASFDKKDLDSDSAEESDFIEVPTVWGLPISKHSSNYVYTLAKANGLEVQKEQKVLADSGDRNSDDILFKTFVTKKDR